MTREVGTKYGLGTMEHFRETDQIYHIQLSFGKLYATSDAIITNHSQNKSMALNDAYESLESMRSHNLEVACKERNIFYTNDDLESSCRDCLLAQGPSRGPPKNHPLGFVCQFVDDRKRQNRKGKQCLACGSRACAKHLSKALRKQSVDICSDCERIFSVDFIIDCMSASTYEARKACISRMIELYDRVSILLSYSAQFIDDISIELQKSKVTSNKVNIGSSSVGVVSGCLGVAAAANILTPAGPPLLLASLLFGSGATAVQTGTDIHNYYSEPNQVATRILALHSMALAILNVASTLRDALTRDFIRNDMYTEAALKLAVKEPSKEPLMNHSSSALVSVTAGKAATTGVEFGVFMSTADWALRDARSFAWTGTNVLKTARLARVAGGALSAAMVVLEARSLNTTLREVLNGSPCEKANALLEVAKSLETMPSTSDLDRECTNYLETMKFRERRITEDEAVQLLLDTFESEKDYCNEEEPTTRLEDDETFGLDEDFHPITEVVQDSSSSSISTLGRHERRSSLAERIHLHKMQQERVLVKYNDEENYSDGSSTDSITSRQSLLQRINLHKRREAGVVDEHKRSLIV